MEVVYAVGSELHSLRDVGRGDEDVGEGIATCGYEVQFGAAGEVEPAAHAFAQVVGACLGFVCPVAGNQVAVFPDFGSYILRGGVVFDVVYYVAAAGLLGEADTFLLEMILVADGEGEGEGFLRGVVSEEDLQFAAVGADEGEFVRMAVDYDAAVVEQSAGGGALAGTVRGVERATEGGEAGGCHRLR